MRALVVLLAVAAPAAADTPAQTLAKVEAVYKKPQDLSASFTQTVTYAINGKIAKTGGKLYLAKPDKVRFDYVKAGKPEKTILFDGKTLWHVQHADFRITKQDVGNSPLPALFRFFTGAGSLTTEFTVGAPKSPKQLVPGTIVLQLDPKKPSAQYSELYLVIDPKSSRVLASTSINSSGDVSTIELADVTNDTIKPRTFVFDAKNYPDYLIESAPKP